MSSSRPVFRSRWLPYVLVAPQLIITIIFFIWPAGEALWYSLQSVDPFGLSSQFVGLDNFVTLFHDPYYQRHVVGAPLVQRVDADGRIHSEANYAVLRTRLSKESTVFNVGRYIDRVVPTPAGLKFSERLAIYDSEMIPNSIIYPI